MGFIRPCHYPTEKARVMRPSLLMFTGLECEQHICGSTNIDWSRWNRFSSVFSRVRDTLVWKLLSETILLTSGFQLYVSDTLFSGSSDNSIKVWSIRLLQLQSTISAHSDPVCTLACNEKYLFSGSLRSIKVF